MASDAQTRLFSASKVFENILRELLNRLSEEIVATPPTKTLLANQSAFSFVLEDNPFKVPAVSEYLIYEPDKTIKLNPNTGAFDITLLCKILQYGIEAYPTYRGKKRFVGCVDPQCLRKCCVDCDHTCIHGNRCYECNCINCNGFTKSNCDYNKILCCDSCKKCGFCNFRSPQAGKCVTYKLKANVETIKILRNVASHVTNDELQEFINGGKSLTELPDCPDSDSFYELLTDTSKEILAYLCNNVHFLHSKKNITEMEKDSFLADIHVALKEDITLVKKHFESELGNAMLSSIVGKLDLIIENQVEVRSVADDNIKAEMSKDANKLKGIEDLKKKMGNSVAICKEVLGCMLEIYSLNHESAKSKDPSIALANILKDIPALNAHPNRAEIIDKGKSDINGMDVALLCEVLGMFPNSMIEKPEHREKRFQKNKQKVLKCKGSDHIKGCCEICKHSCQKCYRPNCKHKICCLTKKKCNHVCVCCELNVKECTKSSFVCCNQCNRCSKCQQHPCKNLKLRQAVEKLKDYHTTTGKYKETNIPKFHDIASIHDDVASSVEIILDTICQLYEEYHDFRAEKIEQIKLELDVTAVYKQIIGDVNMSSEISQERSDTIDGSLKDKYENYDNFPLPWNKQNILKLSDIYINTKCITSELGDKDFKPDLLEVLEIGNQKRIIVAALGGMGKTTISKQLCVSWARNKRLRKYCNVIRLDIKDIKGASPDDIYDAILRFLGRRVTVDERSKLENSIEIDKEKTLFVLDGLDEAPSYSKEAVNCFFGNEQLLQDSTVVVLSRPEGEGDIDCENTKCVNFIIEKLSRRQVTKFVSKTYKFESDIKTCDRLLEDRKKLKILNVLLAFPIYTVMLCGLYDDKNLRDPLEDSVDIFLAVIALLIKTEKIKHLTSFSEKKAWNKKKSRDIIHCYFNIISALGFAVYKMNGNNFRVYEHLSESEVRDYMSSYLKDVKNAEVEIESALRWGFLDRYDLVTTSCETVLRFSHRHFRDLVSSFYLMTMSKKQLQDSAKPLLDSSEQVVIRYAIDVLHKLKYQSEGNYVDNLFSVWDECNEDSDFFLCYLLMCYISLPDARERIIVSIKKFLVSCMKKHNKGNCCRSKIRHHVSHYLACIFSRLSIKGGEEVLSPESEILLDNYLKVLVNHSAQNSACEKCVLPRKIANSFPKRNFFKIRPPNKDGKSHHITFSEEKTYGVSKLMKLDQSSKRVVLVFPSNDHVSKESIYVLLPQKEEGNMEVDEVPTKVELSDEELRKLVLQMSESLNRLVK